MIALIIDSMERFEFFKRIGETLKGENIAFCYIVSEPLAYLQLKVNLDDVCYVHKGFCKHPSLTEDMAEEVSKSIEVLTGALDYPTAQLDFFTTYNYVLQVLKRRSVERIILWNGQQLLCRAITAAAGVLGVSCKFLEISNLPNKIFCDPKGVNALSTLAIDAGVLDSYQAVDESFHEQWINSYVTSKTKKLPQSVVNNKKRLKSFLNQCLKKITFGVVSIRLRYLFNKKTGAVSAFEKSIVSNDSLLNTKYVFLPLQVSSDTQIKLHSDIDNFGAIIFAKNYASTNGCNLLIKIHPAESDVQHIEQIVKEVKGSNSFIVNFNTTDCIKNATSVITINSTVGLESMLLKKHTIVLGRCFYKNFNNDRLLKYVHRFLIDDVDYFSSSPIDRLAIQRIIN